MSQTGAAVEQERVLELLKPLCIAAVAPMEYTSNEVELEALSEAFPGLAAVFPVGFSARLPYACQPFVMTLDNERVTMGQREAALRGLYKALMCGSCDDALFYQLLSKTSMALGTQPGARTIVTSEDFKLAGVKLLSMLLQSRARDRGPIDGLLCLPQLRTLLAHTVSVLLDLAGKEKHRDLRRMAMTTLAEFTRAMSRPAAVADFLPGASSALCKIALGDPKQGSRVISTALEVWSIVVAEVMANEKHPKLAVQPSSLDTLRKLVESQGAPTSAAPATVLSEQWFTDVARRLESQLTRCMALTGHQKYEVRTALVRTARTVAVSCSLTMAPCVPRALEILVGAAFDEMESVRDAARVGIRDMAAGSGDAFKVRRILLDNLGRLLPSLPRVLSSTVNDSTKTTALRVITGHVAILGCAAVAALERPPLLTNLMLALAHVLALDVSDVRVLEEYHRPNDAPAADPSGLHIWRFLNFRSDAVRQAAENLCRLLGFHASGPGLVECCLSIVRTVDNPQRTAAGLVLNEMITGMAAMRAGDSGLDDLGLIEGDSSQVGEVRRKLMLSVVRQTTRAYFDELEHMREDTPGVRAASQRNTSSDGNGSLVVTGRQADTAETIATRNTLLLLRSVLVSGIGVCATAAQTNFRPLLVSTLFAVLLERGRKEAIVAAAAERTLSLMAVACGYANVKALVLKNCDYVVDALCQSMRLGRASASTLQVLHATLMYTGASVLPLLDETLSVIYGGLDAHTPTPLPLFTVLLAALNAMDAVLIQHNVLPEPDPLPAHRLPRLQSRRVDATAVAAHARAVLKRVSAQRAGDYFTEGATDQGEHIEVEEGEENEESDKKPVERRVRIVNVGDDGLEYLREKGCDIGTEILIRTRHFTAARSRDVQLVVLSVFEAGLRVIGKLDTKKANALRPLIHDIWPNLERRLSDADPLVVVRALEVMNTVIVYGRDFMSNRFKKDAWPRLRAILEANPPHVGEFPNAPAHRLPASVMRAMAAVVPWLAAHADGMVWELATATLPYLSGAVQPDVQDAAVAVWRQLAVQQPDVVWSILAPVLARSSQYVPPSTPAGCVPLRLGSGKAQGVLAPSVKVLFEELR